MIRVRVVLVSLLVPLVVAAPLWVATPAQAAGPDTVIKKGPSGTVRSTSATFAFKAKPKKGAKFQCRMDSGRWKRCTSPVSYTGLAQGRHTFAVRAKASGKKDRTPATRTFTVDTVGPTVTISSGPSGTTDDTTPTFAFAAPGATSFGCAVGAGAFQACTSPFTVASPLPDAATTFRVRATDAVGNVGPVTSRAFTVDRVVTPDLATATEAAGLWVPAQAAYDVPASCGGNVRVDCPNDSPLAPTDQVTVAPSSSVVATDEPDVFTLSALTDVLSVPGTVIKVTVEPIPDFQTTCDLTVDSSLGEVDGWTAAVPIEFVEVGGETRVRAGAVEVSGVEAADAVVTNGGLCGAAGNEAAGALVDQVESLLESVLEDHVAAVGNPLCAAPGPDHLGPCPP